MGQGKSKREAPSFLSLLLFTCPVFLVFPIVFSLVHIIQQCVLYIHRQSGNSARTIIEWESTCNVVALTVQVTKMKVLSHHNVVAATIPVAKTKVLLCHHHHHKILCDMSLQSSSSFSFWSSFTFGMHVCRCLQYVVIIVYVFPPSLIML